MLPARRRGSEGACVPCTRVKRKGGTSSLPSPFLGDLVPFGAKYVILPISAPFPPSPFRGDHYLLHSTAFLCVAILCVEEGIGRYRLDESEKYLSSLDTEMISAPYTPVSRVFLSRACWTTALRVVPLPFA